MQDPEIVKKVSEESNLEFVSGMYTLVFVV